MRDYKPNPKHEQAGAQGRKGTRMDLSPVEAKQLLNSPRYCFQVPGKRQFVAVHKERIYLFQDDGAGAYHAYPISGNEVCQKYMAVAQRVCALLGVNYKRLSRMRDL